MLTQAAVLDCRPISVQPQVAAVEAGAWARAHKLGMLDVPSRTNREVWSNECPCMVIREPCDGLVMWGALHAVLNIGSAGQRMEGGCHHATCFTRRVQRAGIGARSLMRRFSLGTQSAAHMASPACSAPKAPPYFAPC